jgi:molybdate transport system substrate-binding protein
VVTAPIRMLCAGAARATATELAPAFTRDTGREVALEFGTAGMIREKMLAGARPDVAAATRAVIAELQQAGLLAAGTAVDLGTTGVGVAVREGAPKPDISSVDAFRRTLLAANSVACIDPASGGTSGIHFASVLKRLGIAREVVEKSTLVFGGYAAERVARGEAELVVQLVCELVPVKGVSLVGPLPEELQLYTTYTGALGEAGNPAARAWLEFLAGPEGRRSFARNGLDAPRG